MLRKLRLHNYRTYLNSEFEFQNRHLIIGKNNSGKTNLVSAIKFLASCGISDLQTASTWLPSGLLEMRNWSSKEPETHLSCTCELDFDGEPCTFTYELSLRLSASSGTKPAATFELEVCGERLTLKSPTIPSAVLLESDGREARILHEEQAARGEDAHLAKPRAPRNATMLSKLYELDTNRRAILFRRYLGNCVLYNLNPMAMRDGWMGNTDVSLSLAPQGHNLANVIFQLKSRNELIYRRLIEHAKIIEPDLEALNFHPTPDQGIIPVLEMRTKSQANWRGLSDGTLRVLAIAYLIEQAAQYPNEFCPVGALEIIEEPENGIAPSQLAKIFDLFEERAPRAQFIFTSHSPYFIDQFDADRKAVTLLTRQGAHTVIASPPPEIAEDSGEDRLTLADQFAAELLN